MKRLILKGVFYLLLILITKQHGLIFTTWQSAYIIYKVFKNFNRFRSFPRHEII